MKNTFRFVGIVVLALFLAISMSYWGSGSPVHAQSGDSPSGPTAQNCFSARYHAATDCDRLASGASVVQDISLVPSGLPGTGPNSFGPTSVNCYSAQFHAASDCDRLASGQ